MVRMMADAQGLRQPVSEHAISEKEKLAVKVTGSCPSIRVSSSGAIHSLL